MCRAPANAGSCGGRRRGWLPWRPPAGAGAGEEGVPASGDPALDADRLWVAAEEGDSAAAARLARALGERGEPAMEGLAERMGLAFDGPGPLALLTLREAWTASVRPERVRFLEAMAWLTARQAQRDAGRRDVY
ncbi:protein of unknown function [Candidatus Hydrogenisulfobacillus filiaventi]|uniref:Uncharacterized protein n=1 Tax=Candidatus Hydrogenisulfobacillus filiaventi TaxID=2707344 RepID=A0A6F8ZF56_9FIRM|nr:protein of unknown function [Candidatus Hydrogenisulfobacillus filiaventi]